MKNLLVIFTVLLFAFTFDAVFAICAADELEWWEACNDTGPANALPLNPVLMLVIFVIGITAAIVTGILIWRKRK